MTKRFPGVVALRNMTFGLAAGEVHVLFGENGAGKSTLVNLIAGTFRPDEGHIVFRGKPLLLDSPADARARGINAVFQEFSLVPTLTVAENMFLGREIRNGYRLDNARMNREAARILSDLGFHLNPHARVDRLPRSSQQMLEIAKALQGHPKVLILDEPTASLTEREAEVLFALIRRLKAEQVGIIYITHRVQEIKAIGDRITVMRDGAYVATLDAKQADENRLVSLMIGRSMTALYPVIAEQPGREILALQDMSLAGTAVRGVNITVRAGEVVGIAGLVGSGKAEIAEACFGLHKLRRGEIRVEGANVDTLSPREMLKRGVYYLPADRRRQGLVGPRSLRENISIASLGEGNFGRHGIILRSKETDAVAALVSRLQIRPAKLDRPIGLYSGGNQQKALFARGLLQNPKVLVLNEPTTGVDVGARADVYALIKEICELGAGVLLISSDLPEILHLSHRAYVVHRGVVRAELLGEALTEKAVLANFFDQ
ncbi:sugar ABC transporter ATP-binding protein [Mesorhizobium sp. M0622]|uniref:sugar ABC transporter ATP-binding protein n=1 Tax=Mesorhizobium sp. M0622 TaxID=2956975 RepID=UPI003336636B